MNILLLGKPGTGKGTISNELMKDPQFRQLSTGDLLRNEAEKDTPLGNKLKELVKTSAFATDDDIYFLVNQFLDENKDKSIIFDGFPRNVKQTEYCLDNGITFDKVFYLTVPNDEILTNRIIHRRIHQPSGRVYNKIYNPPKVEGFDDITGEPLVQRKDDHIDIIAGRMESFYKNTEPLLNILKERNIEVIELDATILPIHQIVLIKSHLDFISPNVKKGMKI